MPVFNKLIYDGTEYTLGGGGNIGEPLNLTVTTSGLDATITREDNEIGTIPPTTFAKSELVRKVGSAPTSPSDGTIVVTETVKDTYKVSGYVDSGLTDGTTYYYRVFSYSDLGGISYCDAVSVTPSGGGWQPGVNTIAYYKLESDLNDYSGNGYNLTPSGTVTYSQLASGKNVCFFNNKATVNSFPAFTGDITFAFWVRNESVYSGYNDIDFVIKGNSHDDSGSTGVTYTGSSQGSKIRWQPSGSLITWEQLFADTNWHLLVCTYNRNTQASNVYIDGNTTPGISFTNSGYPSGSASIFQLCNASSTSYTYLSEVIVEDKLWSGQDGADYFDATKSDYGVS